MDVGIWYIWQLPSGAALIEIKSSVPSHSAGDVHQAARHLETLFLKIGSFAEVRWTCLSDHSH